jgi:hypothetical protein
MSIAESKDENLAFKETIENYVGDKGFHLMCLNCNYE